MITNLESQQSWTVLVLNKIDLDPARRRLIRASQRWLQLIHKVGAKMTASVRTSSQYCLHIDFTLCFRSDDWAASHMKAQAPKRKRRYRYSSPVSILEDMYVKYCCPVHEAASDDKTCEWPTSCSDNERLERLVYQWANFNNTCIKLNHTSGPPKLNVGLQLL